MLGGSPTASGGSAPYAYSWLPVAGLSNNLTANPTANIIGNTTYKLTITDNNACQNIDSVNLLFNPSGPFADAGFGNDTSCTSGSILLGGAPTAAGGTPPGKKYKHYLFTTILNLVLVLLILIVVIVILVLQLPPAM